MKAKIFTLLFICFFTFNSQAQSELYVDTTITAEQMVMDFFDGECVTVSNVTFTGDGQSKGYFEGANTNIGIPAGMLLSSGRATNAIGPNITGGISSVTNGGMDPDLEAIANGLTNDAAVLEFDLMSDTEDTIYFYYAFASDEYPEFAGSFFNDVFAFFVEGAGYNGSTNIALLPDELTPVTINNVNANTNSMYYVDNIGGIHIEYDGFTVELGAPFVVQANENYHIKIAVADVGDSAFDSGVFLGIESLCGDSLLIPPAETQFSLNGNTISFVNQSLYATEYFWDFGDGNTSTDRYPEPHTYLQDGYYTVSLTTQNYCCSDTWTALVPVGSVLDIDVNACETTAFQLDAVPPGVGEEGQWSVLIGEGDVIDVENPNAILNNPSIGINMLEWRISELTSGNLVLADTFVLNVSENPEAVIETDISFFCENDPPVLIEASPSGGEFEGTVTGGNIFDPQLAGPGAHTIVYTITDDNGCIGMTSEIATVLPAPEIEIVGVSNTYCEDDAAVQLAATPLGGLFGGAGVTGTTFDPAAAGAGNHMITYEFTDINGCSGIETIEVEVVAAPPTPEIILIGSDSLFANVAGMSYSWELNGELLNTDDQQIQIQGDGNYTVFVISQEGCISEVSQVFSFTGFFDLTGPTYKSLEISPNPAKETLQIKLPGQKLNTTNKSLKIFNTLGQAISIVQWEGNENKMIYDIQSLKSGVYYIQVQDGESYYTGSFIKQ